jgi:quinoprotein glucose dehydrogenase
MIKRKTLAFFLAISTTLIAEETMPKLDYTKWSGDLNVPDPVAISFDNLGRAYVTQTMRRKSQDLDIRQNQDWIPNDVGMSSVDQKRTFFHEQLPLGGDSKRVEDLNGDGTRDWHDLMVLSEKIHRYVDTDGDGTADATNVFAENFQTEVTGIAAGVLWHEGDVYATIAPDVWKLRDTNDDGVADTREVMTTGYGMHIAYAGHDTHGLTVGPDGKIYWTVGDKGINTTSKEGRHFFYPNQGGVMRCNQDGSELEVFAHGLRNVQELAFDEFGNLFGVDNDADKSGERERLVYIAQGIDAGWRCNYQYRGEGEYNPWMDEKIWHTRNDEQPAYITPPLDHATNGPAGFVYNPGTALSGAYRDYFFLTEAPAGKQYAFRMKPDGASFKRENEHLIGAGIPLVGLNFGIDGGLYGVDWGGGYPLNETGAIWKIDVPGAADHPDRKRTKALLRAGEFTLKELGDADQRVRLAAQFQFVRQKNSTDFREIATDTKQPLLARIHAIWGLDQLDAELPDLSVDTEPEIRAQFARLGKSVPRALLNDPSPRVRYFAAISQSHPSFEDAFALIAENNGSDLYLRHAGITALANIGGAEKLVAHASREVRLCAVVALRRNASPTVARFLHDSDKRVAAEAARAIHDDLSIPDALPELAACLTQTYEPFAHRAINANLRIGDKDSAKRLAAFVANEEAPTALREVAMNALMIWTKPPVLDQVDGRYRELGERDPSIAVAAVAPHIHKLLASSEVSIVEKVITFATSQNVELAPESTMLIISNDSAPVKNRVAALRNNKSPLLLDIALKSSSPELRMSAAELLVEFKDPRATDYVADRLASSTSLAEQQKSLQLLGTLKALETLTPWVKALSEGKVAADIQLDLIEALTACDLLPSPPADFKECLNGGDPKRGESIFANHIAAQCIRCHKVDNKEGGSIVGPNLMAVAQKGREFLLQSVVNPGAVIAEGYGNVVISLKDGKTIAGIHKREDAETLVIQLPDVSLAIVRIEDIVTRTPLISTMPPMSAILTKREIRDVIAYLATLDGKRERKKRKS